MVIRALRALPLATLAAIELTDLHTVASLLLCPTLVRKLTLCIKLNASAPSHALSRTYPPPTTPVFTLFVAASSPSGVVWHNKSKLTASDTELAPWLAVIETLRLVESPVARMHNTLVEAPQTVVSHPEPPRRPFSLEANAPKEAPSTELMSPTCAATTLEAFAPRRDAALKDKEDVKDATLVPAVIINALLDPCPVACLVATVVSESQVEASAEVESSRSFAVESILANCDPLTVAAICSLKKLMPENTLLVKGKSYVNTCVLDCSRAPDVRTCVIDACIPKPVLHLIELPDIHSLASGALPPTRSARLRTTKSNVVRTVFDSNPRILDAAASVWRFVIVYPSAEKL
jgi:hypothetical protein